MLGDAAQNLPVDLPLAGGGQLPAPFQRPVPVCDIRPQGDRAGPFQVVHHRLPHVGVLRHIAVGGNHNLHALLLIEGLLLLDPGLVLRQLRLLRQLVGPVDRLEGAPKLEAHFQERQLLALLLQFVHVVGQDLHVLLPEHAPHKVRQGLEPGAHVPVEAEIADSRDQNIVALSRQRGHVAQVNFQRQTRLVNGQGRPPLHDLPVRRIADRGLHPQLPEEGAPKRAVPVVQHRPGKPDHQPVLVHCHILDIQ